MATDRTFQVNFSKLRALTGSSALRTVPAFASYKTKFVCNFKYLELPHTPTALPPTARAASHRSPVRFPAHNSTLQIPENFSVAQLFSRNSHRNLQHGDWTDYVRVKLLNDALGIPRCPLKEPLKQRTFCTTSTGKSAVLLIPRWTVRPDMKMAAYWDSAPSTPVGTGRCFGEDYWLHYQGYEQKTANVIFVEVKKNLKAHKPG